MASAGTAFDDAELFVDESAVDITKFKLPEISFLKEALPSNEEEEEATNSS